MLILEQVSIINNLKATEKCRNKQLFSGKKSNHSKNNMSVGKTPSSVPMVKISLKLSTTRLTETYCSKEIKRRLLLGRKVMTNLDSILKNRDITLPTKVHLVKAMVFPVVMYECESWTIKKAKL